MTITAFWTLLVVVTSAAANTEITADEPLVCDCNGKLANMSVCGTDNVTYYNICLLKEAQQTAPNLGRRCIGQCPCNQTVPAFCSHRGIETEFTGFRKSDFDGNFEPEHMVGIIGIEHAPYGEEHVKRCFFSGMNSKRPSHFGGRFPARPGRRTTTPAAQDSGNDVAANSGRHGGGIAPPSPTDPVCMTDGSTAANMKVAGCLLHSTSNTELGVRCLGKCDECTKEPACPVAKKPLSRVIVG